jgi:hypothetical protein
MHCSLFDFVSGNELYSSSSSNDKVLVDIRYSSQRAFQFNGIQLSCKDYTSTALYSSSSYAYTIPANVLPPFGYDGVHVGDLHDALLSSFELSGYRRTQPLQQTTLRECD